MSSWHVQQLKFAFGIGGLMSFYGIVGFLAWFGGQKMGLPVNTRIMVIVVLLLTLPFTLLIGYLATRRSKKKEEEAKKEAEAKAEEKTTGQEPQKAAAPTGTYQDLPSGTEEVVKFLQSSNLGGANGKEAVYELPWYIVAGIPKSGKSSLVLGSNLNFQTLPSQRQSEQKIIRPTRNIDWRVTSDAVFVDTAGRYQTEGGDEDEWNSLLETIKKYRANRPIDGMIVTADTERILGADERQIEEMAKVMRTRLDEAMQRLKVRFPVYLVFTRADAIEGFRDSFSTSKKEGETLVWGATIPLEKTETAHSMFDEEYGLLQNAVMKRRLMRLSAPFPPVRQLRIFNFPLHFGSARRKLGAFVAALFRPNPFSENPFLRGYYFTAVPAGRQPVQGDKTMGGAPATVGTTYFTQKFFRDVLLRDKDLVRTFQEQRQKPPILGWLVTLLGAALVLILLILAGVSLVNNQRLLKASEDKGSAVLNIVKSDGNINPLSKTPDAATREVDAIEDLRVLMVQLDNYDRNGAPIYLGMGLYSGNTIYKGSDKSKGLLNIYYNAVGRRYMDPTVKRLEDELKKFAAAPAVGNNMTPQDEDNLSRAYDLLKVYLMLSDKYREKSNDTDIVNVLKEFWFTESKLPASLKDDAESQLKFYAKQCDRFDGPDRFPRIQNDSNLVNQVRDKLKAFPPFKRYYKRKVTEISKEVEGKFGELSVEAIVQRNSGDPGFLVGTVAVPGAYSIEGFKLMDKAINQADKELSETDWVMTDDKPNVKQEAAAVIESQDAVKIRDLYFRDYADRWRDFVKNVRVIAYRKETDKDSTRVSAKDALSSFSSANSPMKALLREIAKNTHFVKPKPNGWWETIKSWFKSDPLPDTGGNTAPEREFRPLFDFVEEKADKNAKLPIDEYQAEISQAYIKYNGFSDSEINELATLNDDDRNKKFPQLNTATSKIDGLAKPFKDAKDSAVGPFLAELLKQPIGNLKALLGADTLKQLGENWANDVLPAAQKAEQGYPFETSDNNADFTNLKNYLSPNSGKLSQFFNSNNLTKYFDVNGGQVKIKDPNNSPFTQEFADYLTKAFTLQKALFSKGDDVKFDYNFEITNPKDALVEMTIDGVSLSSADKPSSPITFPASTGGGNGVLIKVSSTTGTTSTSGTTTSANSSSNPVNNTGTTNSATPSKFLANTGGNNNSPAEKSFLGPWGLFRFFDASGPQKQSDNSYQLSYKLNGKTLNVKITPSGVDPFNKEIYKLRAPKTILK
ncbi:MAG: type VI secretion system membrane subunit TssM [Acidobacteria bacterium]|nr:type VI secretion system membrane subunit TssM [Acidobacteriota bacterium]